MRRRSLFIGLEGIVIGQHPVKRHTPVFILVDSIISVKEIIQGQGCGMMLISFIGEVSIQQTSVRNAVIAAFRA